MSRRVYSRPHGESRRHRGWVLLLGLVLFAGSCGRVQPPHTDVSWEAYSGLIVPAPVLPFVATGSAMIRYRGDRETGSIRLEGTARKDYALRLSARVIGTTALEIRFNADDLLVLDFTEDTYYAGPNTAESRLRVFSLDITPAEFQMALTGRIPARRFSDGQGTVEPDWASFSIGEATYGFLLGPDGLPVEWTKSSDGAIDYRVVYREYMNVETGGAPFRVPRKIRIFEGNGEPLAVLGLGTFQPWRNTADDVSFSVDPAAGLRFQPLEIAE